MKKEIQRTEQSFNDIKSTLKHLTLCGTIFGTCTETLPLFLFGDLVITEEYADPPTLSKILVKPKSTKKITGLL
eukprot:snap_masked-scaffold_3-processed-gene-3.50-mRNA-1 protein AED:1.00 eAED:1.00 QI:0/0/0/0/1/1/2/0/73